MDTVAILASGVDTSQELSPVVFAQVSLPVTVVSGSGILKRQVARGAAVRMLVCQFAGLQPWTSSFWSL